MNLPDRRRLGAIALIVAGIGAFMVPFLLHAPSTQASSTTKGGGGTTTTTTTPTTPAGTCTTHCPSQGCTGASCSPGSPGSCTDDKSPEKTHSDSGKHNGHAWGELKNDMDTTVALVKAMGSSNPAFHSHHATDTDNHTVHSHNASSQSPGHQDSSCTEDEEEHDD